MPGPEFFQTLMGQRFFNAQLPALIERLDHIAVALERIVSEEPDISKVGCKSGRWSSEESNLSNKPRTKNDEGGEMDEEELQELIGTIGTLFDEIDKASVSPVGVAMFDESMDNLVHQLASEYASTVNNEGHRSQIEYILKNLGLKEGSEDIRTLLKEAVEA